MVQYGLRLKNPQSTFLNLLIQHYQEGTIYALVVGLSHPPKEHNVQTKFHTKNDQQDKQALKTQQDTSFSNGQDTVLLIRHKAVHPRHHSHHVLHGE